MPEIMHSMGRRIGVDIAEAALGVPPATGIAPVVSGPEMAARQLHSRAPQSNIDHPEYGIDIAWIGIA